MGGGAVIGIVYTFVGEPFAISLSPNRLEPALRRRAAQTWLSEIADLLIPPHRRCR